MEGRAFLGRFQRPGAPYLFGLRGRMDERIDLVRAVRDTRFLYVRNFMPHRIYGQHVAYMFETPTTRVWKELFDAGALQPPRTYFWGPKPPEELYDTESDPDQVRNLAGQPEHLDTLRRLSDVLHAHMLETRDLGLLPEAEMHARSAGTTPHDMARDGQRYPVGRILAMAELAAGLNAAAVPDLIAGLKDPDSAVRYWAAAGLLMRGDPAVAAASAGLQAALDDPSPSVRVVAAEALARFGTSLAADAALARLVDLSDFKKHGLYVAVAALNAVDELDGRAVSQLEALKRLPRGDASVPARLGDYMSRILEKTLRDLGAGEPPVAPSPGG
jgi:uncharacterized sulfatase